MSDLYEVLAPANRTERVSIASQIVNDIRQDKPKPHAALFDLYTTVIDRTLTPEQKLVELEHVGEFGPSDSASLIRNMARVRGYMNGIARSPQAETIIDAGCGSSAILAVGSEILHPRASVIGYELNAPSAACATEVVRLLGLDDRITIAQGDVLTDPLPNVDLAVTETFHKALTTEKGPQITARLATIAQTVLPATAKVYAADILHLDQSPEPLAATVDLTVPNKAITGSFPAYGTGLQRADVYTGFYDAAGDAIIDGRGRDTITGLRLLGHIMVPEPDATINFSYPPGVELVTHNPARLWLS